MPGLATEVRPVAAAARRPATSAPRRRDLAPALAAALALVVGLVMYLAMAAPSVQGGDSGEFQFVAYVLGIPHPPGYPFYAVFGKLWTLLLPSGEIARRMNLMSAVFAAGALGALAWAAARAYRSGLAGAAAGLVAALWLAVAPTWWSQATIASVRPPTGFFVAAVLAGLAGFAASRRPAWLYAAAALYGLGLTHHISLYTFAPPVLLFVLVTAPDVALRPSVLARAVLAGGLPLLLYLYLPLRSAMGSEFDASHPTTPEAFLALISARGFAGDMLYFDPLSTERLELGRQILLTNFDALGLGLALLGGLATLLWRPRWFLLTGGVALINLWISLSYRAPVIADYLIPTYVVMALWIGGLVAAAAAPLRRLGAPGPAAAAGLVVGAAPGSTILTDWYHATVLWYGQLALGERRDLRVEYVSPEGAEVPWLRRAEAALVRGPVYTTALDRDLGQRRHLQPAGPLYELAAPRPAPPASGYPVPGTRPSAPPPDATPLEWRYGDAIELLAYRLETPTAQEGADVAVSLYWTAHRELPQEYREFVHLTDAAGQVWGQRDGVPGEGLYGTSRWRAGELVAERYALTVAPTAPPGQLSLRVGLYETLATPPGWRRLEAQGPDGAALGDAPVLGPVEVHPVVVPADTRAAPATAANVGEAGAPASLLPLGEGQGEGLPGRGGAAGTSGDSLTGRVPGALWAGRGTLSQRERDVFASVWRASGGRAASRLERLLRGDGGEVGVPGWAATSGRLWLPFGKRALLTGWSLDRGEAAPGETVRIGLDFLPLSRIPEDAAVFVHLVDRAGGLRAQSDSVPVGGGLPTLRWAPDRPVRDTRWLRLPADLAPGEYQLRAGMYVMATGAHLPVLDERLAREGQGEHVVLTELRVRT